MISFTNLLSGISLFFLSNLITVISSDTQCPSVPIEPLDKRTTDTKRISLYRRADNTSSGWCRKIPQRTGRIPEISRRNQKKTVSGNHRRNITKCRKDTHWPPSDRRPIAIPPTKRYARYNIPWNTGGARWEVIEKNLAIA